MNRKTILKSTQFDLPKRLWEQLVIAAHIPNDLRWAEVNKQQLPIAIFLLISIFKSWKKKLLSRYYHLEIL